MKVITKKLLEIVFGLVIESVMSSIVEDELSSGFSARSSNYLCTRLSFC